MRTWYIITSLGLDKCHQRQFNFAGQDHRMNNNAGDWQDYDGLANVVFETRMMAEEYLNANPWVRDETGGHIEAIEVSIKNGQS